MGVSEVTSCRAVFVDRDGVINADVWNPATGEWESPHAVQDFRVLPGVMSALGALGRANFKLFLVSNQPSYAKGKTSLENIKAVQGAFELALAAEGLRFTEFYYAYSHPHSVVPGFGPPCVGRKPDPYFLLQARDRHGIDLAASWMVGDRDTDIACGRAAGTRTIRIRNPHGKSAGEVPADAVCDDLSQAVRHILEDSLIPEK